MSSLITKSKVKKKSPRRKRRLIDRGLLQFEATTAGLAERYGRGETSHTIHVWWARRPHASMRALVFASLARSDSADAWQLLTELPAAALGSATISKARNLLLSSFDQTPKLLDMFGGGGTIAFESSLLGVDTYSIDSNELSVFIQKSNLEGTRFINKQQLLPILKESGEKTLEELARQTEALFPLRHFHDNQVGADPVTNYLWTYSLACPKCNFKFYLSKRHWLSRKKRELALIISDGKKSQKVGIGKPEQDGIDAGPWLGKNGSVKCPSCGAIESNIRIDNCKDELVAIVASKNGSGKSFSVPDEKAMPSQSQLEQIERELLCELELQLPTSRLPKWSGIINPSLYGIDTHADFFNRRQRVVMLMLIKVLRQEYRRLCRTYSDKHAKVIIGLLSALMDQLVDWNCRLSMWIPQNEQVGRAFSGPGVAMLWDYSETDPVGRGPANLHEKLKRIIVGASSLQYLKGSVHVTHAYAQSLPYKDSSFDAIVTDPPYYDNLYYNALADFFFSWKRLLLESVEPDLFGVTSTDDTHELVASKYRSGDAASAHTKYCIELSKALSEAARVLQNDGVLSFVYSHSSINGWLALIEAFRSAPLHVNDVQPLSIERRQRPRAMTSDAINTCMVFVARKSQIRKSLLNKRAIEEKLARLMKDGFADDLEKAGWQANDIGLALLAHCVGDLSNTRLPVNGNEDEAVLETAEQLIRTRFPDFKLTRRASL